PSTQRACGIVRNLTCTRSQTMLSDRQSDTAPFADAFAHVVRERRSVRGFLDRPLPQAQLERIFALAQQAPSNCNTQPWHTCVVSGARRARLADILGEAAASGEFTMDMPYNSQEYDSVFKARRNEAATCL